MPASASERPQHTGSTRGQIQVVGGLGVAQIFAWGSSYYLLAVLARPIADETGWSAIWIAGGLSLGLLVAGTVSPWIGRTIERRGGRPVLAASTVLLAAGLCLLAAASNLATYVAAWLIVGLGMGAGLYDPAFATLGRLYGDHARSAITRLTLIAGFASTVSWPLSAFLVSNSGWRGACLVYAAINLALLLPLYLFTIPREAPRNLPAEQNGSPEPSGRDAQIFQRSGWLFVAPAVALALAAMISTIVSVHLLAILQLRGIDLAAAVAFGALVGPSQVGARLIELFIARYHHPVWTKLVSAFLVAVGIACLWTGLPVLTAALIFYGAGVGLESIARGTLPLALFGGPGYAALMGRLARPSLVAQAAAPSIGAALLSAHGSGAALTALLLVALANFVLALAILAGLRHGARRRS
jgi:predicted MFS family arabinose efflux permease